MTPAEWRRIEEVFQAAAEVPTRERAEFLSVACNGDAALRARVESMLEADRSSATFLRGVLQEEVRQASAEDQQTAENRLLGRRFGPWRITGVAGRGGMSSVYRAVRDDDQFHKQVALKVLRYGLDSEFAGVRFRYERQILAQLEHPNIARLIDGGQTSAEEEEIPYLVMELVSGAPITTYCRAKRLSLAARLQLFLAVCAAVRYAHAHMVVHRDIKPGNILVDAEGAPKLLDFGIAKLMDPSLNAGELSRTSTGFRMMTPEYASPEQVRGEPVTAATDIYSLGAVLYEMLSGERAHRITKDDPLEVAKVVCQTAMTRPSLRAPAAMRKALEGDLDNIVLKALSKEPARRYQSVDEFAEDVRRYLAGLPVRARKDTLAYRTRKFVGRNRVSVAIAALAAAGLAYSFTSAIVERRRAEARFQDVHELVYKFLFDFDLKIRQVPGTTSARELLVSTALQYLDRLSNDAGNDGALQAEMLKAYQKIGDVQGMYGLPNLGRPKEAIASYQKALAISRSLVARHPEVRDNTRSLAQCLARLAFLQVREKDFARAVRGLQEALAAEEKSLQRFSLEYPDMRILGNGYIYLSTAEKNVGQIPAAVEAARQGREWMARCAAIRKEVRSRSDLARATGEYGLALQQRGDLAGAEANFREEETLRRAIEREAPNHLENLRELAAVEGALGALYGDPYGPNFGKPDEARRYLSIAKTLRERLKAADPNNALGPQDLAEAYADDGEILMPGKPDAAALLFRKAMEQVAQLPDDDAEKARDAAGFKRRLADALVAAHAGVNARKAAEDALAATLQAYPNPSPGSDRVEIAEAYRLLGEAQAANGDLPSARASLAKAIDLLTPMCAQAAVDLPLAMELDDAWSAQERLLQTSGDAAGAAQFHALRAQLWRGWNESMPSDFVKRRMVE